MRSWLSRTQRSRTCCPENCNAVCEAAGGRCARDGTRVVDWPGLQCGEAVADGVVSATKIVHGARSGGDRSAQRACGSQAALGVLEALRPLKARWPTDQPQAH